MSLREPVPGLRTIHNGSNDVAKVSVVVPAGSELSVCADVAEQLMAASGAFKDGPAPVLVEADPVPADDEPVKPAKKAAGRK